MTCELKPHDSRHPYVASLKGCGHGVLFKDYCKDCDIVSTLSMYESAIRRAQRCLEKLHQLDDL